MSTKMDMAWGRRSALLVWCVGLMTLVASGGFSEITLAAEDTPATRRPNVLLVITDDQGWGDFSRHGNDQLQTPAFDRLVSQGASFERFYVCPVCAPTRAGLLTGRYHLRGGVTGVTKLQEWLRPDEITLAEVFKQAGYVTGCFGKWHNGGYWPAHPRGQGFEQFLGFCGGHWNNYFDSWLEHNGQPKQLSGYIADALTNAANEFIAQHREQPFFCYLAYNTPHSPFQVPEEYYARHRARGHAPDLAAVYAMCENIDHNLGRLLQQIEQLDLRRDTIVLFLTDNGPNTDRYNGGMRGRKGSVHEGGIRVPLVVRWPRRIRPGCVVPQIASCIDVLPTLVELCGLEHQSPIDKPLDGRSLVPLLTESKQPWPERTLFTWRGENKQAKLAGSARTQRWRWVTERGEEMLFDMDGDPGQQHNLVKEQASVATDLRGQFERWLNDVSQQGFERPRIVVGADEARQVELLAPDSTQAGGVKFHAGPGFSNDWLVHWTQPSDEIGWDIAVSRPGNYRITLKYTCPDESVGSVVRATAGETSLESKVTEAFDPPLEPRPNRDQAKNTYDDKPWRAWSLGQLTLPAGNTRLSLTAPRVAGKEVLELKSATIERVE